MPSTNRLGVAPGYTGRMDYDAAGNLENDTYTSYGRTDGIPTRLYDAENRLTSAKDGNLQVVSSYSYNADGQRTRRKVGSNETWQVYGMEGELLGEYASGAAPFVATKEYGYRNGELLVTVSSGDDQRLKRFLQALYYGALQVDAPSQWMTDKTNELAAAGVQSQAQLLVKAKEIARALFVQTTYETNPSRSDIQYVTDLYYAYAQRGPDASGLGWWVPQAAGSVQNRINVLNAWEVSGEFLTLVSTLYGTSTSDNERTEHFVNNFYLAAYGLNATPTQLQQQRDSLNSAAALGQSQVQAQAETMGRALFVGQVNDSSISNTQYVTNLYEAFLQRGPDASGLSFWSGQASVGQGRQNVLSQFATCPPFRELAGTLYREAFWLVADNLGTPRMIVNKSGSLAGVKRHDYLPFGEEIGGPQVALIGGRTTTQGYTADSVRQHFTGYEADGETGLNFAQARYQSPAQGRFTSVDPLGASASVASPQSFNRYSYVENDPLNYNDPTGMALSDIGVYQTDNPEVASKLENEMVRLVRQNLMGGSRSQATGIFHEIVHLRQNPCDETLGKTFGDRFTVAAGNGVEPAALDDRFENQRGGNLSGKPSQWPHLFGYSAHFYASSDTESLGFAQGNIYVPNGFTDHAAFTSDGHWFYYPKTNVTLLVMHIQNFGIRPNVRNEARSVLIGQMSTGGGGPGYIHSHLELHRGRGVPNASFKKFPDENKRRLENQRLRDNTRVFFPSAFCK